MTRNECVGKLAREMALRDHYEFQKFPNVAQYRKETRYLEAALAAIKTVESAMKDFAWSPEK